MFGNKLFPFKLIAKFFVIIYCYYCLLVPSVEASFWQPQCESEQCHIYAKIRAKKQGERAQILDELKAQHMRRTDNDWIVDLPFEELVSRLQSRALSATSVLSAFIGSSVKATLEFNCITEFIPDAMDWAKDLDALPAIKGPLHGVPFCVKDDHNVKGMDSTLGYSRNLYHPSNRTATIVQIFQDLGAVPFCKTNVPQTLLSFGSDNPIFGTTLNPLNKNLTPGGSSSGTGCLVGAKAIHFGLGTDAAGSGRLPAHFNGISSLMPTSRRLSYDGIVASLPNLIGVTPVIALFASKPSTLLYVFKAITENNVENANDPETVPISWNSSTFEEKRPLRVGYFTSLPFFPTMGDTPGIVLKTKDKLEELGHTLVPFEMPDAYEYMKINGDLIFADGGKYVLNQIRDDEISLSFRTFYLGLKFPNWQRRIAASVPIAISSRLQLTLRAGLDTETSDQLQEAIAAVRRLRRKILKQMKDKKLDLILSPVFPVPAVRIEDPPNLFLAVAYVVIWNLVDFPAGVIPMGVESGRRIADFNTGGDFFLSLAKTNLKNAIGMPIGVQLIGKPYQEELILRIMNELKEVRL